MPGSKPVIPEVVNQVFLRPNGNTRIRSSSTELNVMEPVLVQSVIESVSLYVLAIRCE